MNILNNVNNGTKNFGDVLGIITILVGSSSQAVTRGSNCIDTHWQWNALTKHFGLLALHESETYFKGTLCHSG